MINLTVRPAAETDVSAIHAITQKAFRMYMMELGIPISLAALRETQEDVAKDLVQKHVFVGVANQMKIVGCVRCQIFGSLVYLSRLAVLPGWQQYGMGQLLVEAVEENSKALGATAIALHTAAQLTKQVRFYDRQGYILHSAANDRGYARGLFIKELLPGIPPPDLIPITNL